MSGNAITDKWANESALFLFLIILFSDNFNKSLGLDLGPIVQLGTLCSFQNAKVRQASFYLLNEGSNTSSDCTFRAFPCLLSFELGQTSRGSTGRQSWCCLFIRHTLCLLSISKLYHRLFHGMKTVPAHCLYETELSKEKKYRYRRNELIFMMKLSADK